VAAVSSSLHLAARRAVALADPDGQHAHQGGRPGFHLYRHHLRCESFTFGSGSDRRLAIQQTPARGILAGPPPCDGRTSGPPQASPEVLLLHCQPRPHASHRETDCLAGVVELEVRRETGKEWVVQVHYDEGVAIHICPEPCGGVRKDADEASAGEGIGQPLSRVRRLKRVQAPRPAAVESTGRDLTQRTSYCGFGCTWWETMSQRPSIFS
jgi:hypothetical protein